WPRQRDFRPGGKPHACAEGADDVFVGVGWSGMVPFSGFSPKFAHLRVGLYFRNGLKIRGLRAGL
ncbi:MAG: hypothetical protein QGI45_10830, partial [Myxococcota bacterium]|nr:hypothetical protein [Myxococcota bacterium]